MKKIICDTSSIFYNCALLIFIFLASGAWTNLQAQNIKVKDLLVFRYKIQPALIEDTFMNAQLVMDLAQKGFLVTGFVDSAIKTADYRSVLYSLSNPETSDKAELWTEASRHPINMYSYRLVIKTQNLLSVSKWLEALNGDQKLFSFLKNDQSSFVYNYGGATITVGSQPFEKSISYVNNARVTKLQADPQWCYITIEERSPATRVQ